ncbi:MAG: hypothetical protein HN980_04770 [Waddliaceae bacterium]|nr:hypothetical protein [Waddliaceae bacterium]
MDSGMPALGPAGFVSPAAQARQLFVTAFLANPSVGSTPTSFDQKKARLSVLF